MDLDLKKLGKLDISYPGIEIGYELWAIESIAETTDRYLPQMRDQYRVHAEHMAWNDESLADEDRVHAIQQMEELTDRVMPRFFRGPELIAIWALLESAVEEIADFIQKRERLEVAFGDIKARDFRSRFLKYFRGVLGMDVSIAGGDWEELSRLQKLRNVLAHRNGRIDTGSEESVDKLLFLVEQSPGVSLIRHRLYFEYEYVLSAIGVVRRAIAALDGAVASRYDWIQLIDGHER